MEEPAKIPQMFVFGPDGFQSPIDVRKISARTYEGRLEIGDRQGLFRVLPAKPSAAFPETGFYRPEAELEHYGSNEALLRQVSAFTGGRFEPEPGDVFTGTGKSIGTFLNLWPAFLAAAIVFSLAVRSCASGRASRRTPDLSVQDGHKVHEGKQNGPWCPLSEECRRC